ncbi:MAG: sigma-70 family RNA polymerase sigma factor [Clostridia bacterium]
MTTTISLIEKAQKGDQKAVETLILENNGLIWSIVRRYIGRGIESDDLYQLGSLGFLKAIKGFDVNYGTQFSTYAVPKISGEIRRFIRDDGMIKVSRSIKDMSYKVFKAREELEKTLGREPHISEISDFTGFDVTEIATCENAMSVTDSLQREVTPDGLTLETTIGNDGIEDEITLSVTLKEAIKKLPPREAEVIYLRFFKGLTQDKISKMMNISQVQVSRIEKKALIMLRETVG